MTGVKQRANWVRQIREQMLMQTKITGKNHQLVRSSGRQPEHHRVVPLKIN